MSRNATNGNTTGNGVLCGSVLMVMSSNNIRIVGSSVFCLVCSGANHKNQRDKLATQELIAEVGGRQLEANYFSSGAAAERCQTARTSCWTRKPRMLRFWKLLPSGVTEDTGLCVIVICEV
jgi:hypothetical protein